LTSFHVINSINYFSIEPDNVAGADDYKVDYLGRIVTGFSLEGGKAYRQCHFLNAMTS